MLEQLLMKNIKIEQVMADASTIHGENICRKLLKMKEIRQTDHDSKIYCQDGEKWIQNLNKWRQFFARKK